MLLEGSDVRKSFSGIDALTKVNFAVKEKKIVGLIGPNGSGKTTLFNVICNIFHADHGHITFRGRDITNLAPHAISQLGIARTFQIPRPYPNLTSLKNVMVGALHGNARLGGITEARAEAIQWLEFTGLQNRMEMLPGSLTIADRKRLEVARALAARPYIILLDEAMSGLNPNETNDAMALVKKIRDDLGISVFMVEHVMRVIMSICDTVMVLNNGTSIAEGRPETVAANKVVIEAYLGEEYARR